MASIKQFIRDRIGGGSWNTRFRKSARASALAFGRAGALGAKAQKAAKNGNAGGMGG